MKKRIISVLLALAMLSSAAACGNTNNSQSTESKGSSPASTEPASTESGGTSSAEEAGYVNREGFPIVNEPITLSVFGSQDTSHGNWEDMLFFQEYEKMTGISLDFQYVNAQGFDEKKNLLFASNEMPDMFLRSFLKDDEITRYGAASGQLLQMDDYLADYAPNINAIMQENEVVKNAQTAADGHIYVLPELDFSDSGKMGFKQWINKDWLEKLNLSVPTTPEELKEVLVAFRDQDPNGNGEADEIPLGIREVSSIYVLGGSWGLDHQFADTFNVEDGKVTNWLTDERFKNYLVYLNDLYTEKLLWQDYYKSDSRPNWRSNLANALFGTFYMPYSDVFLGVEDQFIGYEPLKGPDGDQLWADATTGITTKGAFAISTSCAYPEAAMRWVDYFYSEEGSIFFRYGIEGETFTYDADGVPQINDEIKNDPDGFMAALGKINLVAGGGAPQITTNETDGIVASALTKEVASILVPFLPETVYAAPSFDEMTQERVNAIRQDLNTYRDESVTKFILGEWDFDQWDTYCKTLEQIGLSELQQIFQDAYDANF